MELCDLYLKYMNALCEGTLAAPEGIALSGETPEERAMSLQAALKKRQRAGLRAPLRPRGGRRAARRSVRRLP